jgi:hypothetical protein
MPTSEQPDHSPELANGAEDTESQGFFYACPRCGQRLEEYSEACSQCGADLAELFSATYRVRTPTAARWIALIALVLVVGLCVVALAVLVLKELGGP